MAYLTTNLLEDGLRRVGILKYGRATGGSTTTIIESSRPSRDVDDSEYAGGVAIMLRDSAGAGAAPEGQFARITSYDGSTYTFTLADTLTAAVASGDRYAVTTNDFSLDELIELMNDALQTFDIPLVDSTLTTADQQTEYDLPVALKQHELYRVRYQGNTDDSNDNDWIDLYDWQIIPSSAGSVAKLVIPQLDADRTIQLWYIGKHSAVNAYSDVVSEYIDPNLAKAALVERIRNRQNEEARGAVAPLRRSFEKASAELAQARIDYPIHLPDRRHKLLDVNF